MFFLGSVGSRLMASRRLNFLRSFGESRGEAYWRRRTERWRLVVRFSVTLSLLVERSATYALICEAHYDR